MTGKNHLITSAVLLPSIGKLVFEADRILPNFLQNKYILDYFHNTKYMISESMIITTIIGIACYILGTLLPDIDAEDSILGKICYIPIPHRVYTHLIYIPLLLLYFGMKHILLFYVGVGYLIHILLDSCSKMGVCFFSPLGYRVYPSGARIKAGHKFYLYYNNTPQENIFTLVICLLSIAFFVYV